MKAGVYIIRNVKNGKVYVGSSANIFARWATHRRELEAGVHHSIRLQRAWLKYGAGAFVFEVVAVERDRARRLADEQRFIDLHKAATSGYNVFPVAGSQTGYRHSAEAIQKISSIQKGRRKPEGFGEKVSAARRGVPVSQSEIERLASIRPKRHTDESRARMSVSKLGNTSRRGCKDSDETRARKSAALKGRPKSEEARRNIAAAIRRRFGKSEEQSNNITVTQWP